MKRSLFWLLDHHPQTGESLASVFDVALDHAVEADRLGFTSLWLAEHHFSTLGTAANPAVVLAAIAQRTEQIRLGPATAVLPLRNPIHVAEDYALVDVLSGGRLNMGVGSGSQPTEYESFGVDFQHRKASYTASLGSVRERWSAAAKGERGPGSINVAPVQSPAPPIYVATMNEDTAYRIGLSGDSLLTLAPPPAPGLDELVARVRAHARGLGEAGVARGGAEAVVMMFAHVAPTEAAVRATVVPALQRLMSAMTGTALPDAVGLYEQMREAGIGLFGTPSEVADRLEQLAELGVRHVAFVSRFGGMPRDVAARSLRMLAPPSHERPAPT